MSYRTIDRQQEARLPQKALDALQATIRGEVLLPFAAAYDEVRKVFNAMIDRRPALIVRCANNTDMVVAVDFARDYGIPLSIRGGGHSVAGNAVCDGGLMLDLSCMKEVQVDPVRRVAVAQAGLTLGELDAATQLFGLATPLGVVSMTGIAGLTLGGGLGWLNGKHGLACDNLLAANVVTADGQLLRAKPDEHPDLFWAIRGGGGNFGVISEFTYQLHPIGPLVLAGTLTYPPARVREVLRFVDAFVSDPISCPDELSLSVSLGSDPTNRQPMVSISACYSGPIESGEKLLQPLRKFGPPVWDTLQPRSYQEHQSASDSGFPPGQLHYWKSSYLRQVSDGAIDVLLDFLTSNPSSATTGVGLQHMHGAASRVQWSETAFPHRHRQYDFLILSQAADLDTLAENVIWTRALFEAMQPFLQRAVYANNLGQEGDVRVKAAYGANYDRLATVKSKYDPTNLFRQNHNVRPTAPER
jgi:hypothetical protein